MARQTMFKGLVTMLQHTKGKKVDLYYGTSHYIMLQILFFLNVFSLE